MSSNRFDQEPWGNTEERDWGPYQRPLGYNGGEPVQVEALEDHQGHHAGVPVVVRGGWSCLGVHQADGCPGPCVSLEAPHRSRVQSEDSQGEREGEDGFVLNDAMCCIIVPLPVSRFKAFRIKNDNN